MSDTDYCACPEREPSVFVNRCLNCGLPMRDDPLMADVVAERSEAKSPDSRASAGGENG